MGVVPVFALADWVRAFQALMPRGRVWPRAAGSIQARAVAALLPGHARQADAAAAEVEDSFPASAGTSLPRWELALRLPDPCAGPDQSVAQRQAHVVARLAYDGGQSVPYFTAYALQLGYPITIEEFAPSRFGSPFGTSFGGPAWAHTWQVTAPPLVVTPFLFGGNAFGDAFATGETRALECELRRLAPAQTLLIFAGSSVGGGIGDFAIGSEGIG